MEIGAPSIVPNISGASPVQGGGKQDASPVDHQGQEVGRCAGSCPGPLPSMSTETFMSLRTQTEEGAQSTLEGLKKILEIVAMMQMLKALQET